MKTDLHSSILWLGPNQLLEARDARGRTLTVVIGELWVTQDGDIEDHVVRAGESFTFDRDGLALAQPLHGAAYVLLEQGVEAQVVGEAPQLPPPAIVIDEVPSA